MKIEKNIPVTGRMNNPDSPTLILRQMEAGDSVRIPTDKVQTWWNCARSIKRSLIARSINSTESRIWLR